jgi:ribonucleoside-diphosphate reductase alpha chain
MEAASLPTDIGVEQHVSRQKPVTDDIEKMGPWATTQYLDKYAWKEDGEPSEVWPDTAYRVVRYVLGALGYTDQDPEFQSLLKYVVQRKFIPGGRYLANSGKRKHQVNNCFLYRCADSISDDDGWADLVSKAIKALSSGGGIGVVYSDVRGNGSEVKSNGNTATGPLSPACMVNEVARHVMAGSRRSAIWGGLHWNHPDIFAWINSKNWSDEIKAAKAADYNAPAPLDMTNISVILDSEFFFAFENLEHPDHDLAKKVYWETVENMISTGEPGFSIDVGQNAGENLRNACTEITSSDDSDVCNLGSINLARVESKEELAEITRLAMLFLICGTVYSDVPHEEVRQTREKNRRTGLGLMGIHEWLLRRGYRYEMVDELSDWLSLWETESDLAAEEIANHHDISVPVKRRAIAPNGTIGIIAETTTSAEPVFCVAYKRRFLDKDKKWKFQYVIDPTAERLIQEGVDPDDIEDAYSLSYNVERRIKFQADLQDYVDHGISSTINLPYPITDPGEVQDFGEILMKYLPRLRGMTCYPDGARAGQPLESVPYHVAHAQKGVTLEENRDGACASGVCGI